MKKIITAISALLISANVLAQSPVGPKPSPFAKIEQTVGLTDVSIKYSRPGAKGRVIFGNLVPYNKLWRTGANANTIITFTDDVLIEGKALAEGSYAIYTIPSKKSCEVIFYSKIDNWGLPKSWDETKVALKTEVNTKQLDTKIESFSISVESITLDAAELEIKWENTLIPLKIEVPTKKKTLKNIAGLSDESSARSLFEAGVFYKEIGENKKALNYLNKAIAKDNTNPFWMLRQQSLIYSNLGNKMKAIKAAKKSLKSAKKAGNTDYVKLNTDSLKEWGVL